MVAKTFQNLPQVGEPFESGGKMYVNVQSKNGNLRRVRWYEVDEYMKMYPETNRADIDKYYKSMKHLFCHDKDYFWVFNDYSDNEIFKVNYYVWYAVPWGWYICPDSPEEEINKLLQSHNMKRLYWNDISIDDNTLKSDSEIKKVVKELFKS